jgi:hypothetical protein
MLSVLGSCRTAGHDVDRRLAGTVERSLLFQERAEHSRSSEGCV